MISELVKALKSDTGFYEAWKAGIAMSFYDAAMEAKLTPINNISEASNKAADKFLELLCKETMK